MPDPVRAEINASLPPSAPTAANDRLRAVVVFVAFRLRTDAAAQGRVKAIRLGRVNRIFLFSLGVGCANWAALADEQSHAAWIDLNLGNDAGRVSTLISCECRSSGKAPASRRSVWPRVLPRAGFKSPEGQENLPQIIGRLWIANGIYPGWQSGERRLADPRELGWTHAKGAVLCLNRWAGSLPADATGILFGI
jgi:hypothetical protein